MGLFKKLSKAATEATGVRDLICYNQLGRVAEKVVAHVVKCSGFGSTQGPVTLPNLTNF